MGLHFHWERDEWAVRPSEEDGGPSSARKYSRCLLLVYILDNMFMFDVHH